MVCVEECHMAITRHRLLAQLRRALGRSRAVVLAGPRQSGKSTLAAALVPRAEARWFDLEHPVDRDRLLQPMTARRARSSSMRCSSRPTCSRCCAC